MIRKAFFLGGWLLGLVTAGGGEGVVVLFDFEGLQGDVIRDRAEAGQALDLKIQDGGAVRRSEGAVLIEGKTLIATGAPARRLTEAVRRSGAFSMEAWIEPAEADQDGPARIVTISKNTSERLFTFGQDGDRFDVRFRTSRTDRNGMPSLQSPVQRPIDRPAHVVFTRGEGGTARLYLNGEPVAERRVEGDLGPWKNPMRLSIGNELTGNRPWRGTIQRVALYARALSLAEVREQFAAGPDGEPEPKTPEEESGVLFTERVAGLLANRCLECHDAATREGDLDLSTELAAFETEGMIFRGNAADSLLWESVFTDEMPHDREPLAAEEKSDLKRWIDLGAVWAVERIDPADYRIAEAAVERWVRRLTRWEYIETVKATTGVDIAERAEALLPADVRADGFSNTAYNLGVDFGHVDAYAKLAREIVSEMDVRRYARRFTKRLGVEDQAMRELISEMGTWLLRGPLDDREMAVYRGITTTVSATGGGFDEAVAYLLEAMLQSPRFLYRIEQQRGDGSRWPVSEYELASRLSYTLWGAPPDEALFQAAKDGELSKPEVLAGQAKRMLEDSRSIRQSERFVSDWLNLNRLGNLRPSAAKFPAWRSELAADMKAETLAFWREVIWDQERPLPDLLNAQVTWVTPRLAAHYGMALGKADSERGAGELVRVSLEGEPARGGLLTQGSVLTIGGDEASMVTRGLFSSFLLVLLADGLRRFAARHGEQSAAGHQHGSGSDASRADAPGCG